MNFEQLYSDIDKHIAAHGLSVMGVIGEFSYSIGMHPKGLPDLIITVGDADTCKMIINMVAQKFMATGAYDGIETELFNMPLMIVPVDGETMLNDYMIHADNYYSHRGIAMDNYRVYQLVLPDRNGIFPMQTGYESERMPQKLLYEVN